MIDIARRKENGKPWTLPTRKRLVDVFEVGIKSFFVVLSSKCPQDIFHSPIWAMQKRKGKGKQSSLQSNWMSIVKKQKRKIDFESNRNKKHSSINHKQATIKAKITS